MNFTQRFEPVTRNRGKQLNTGRRVLVVLLIMAFAVAQTRLAFGGAERLYTIQVFATQDEKNAVAEVTRLRAYEQSAYLVKAAIAGKGLFYRVRLGRFATQQAAQGYAEALRNDHLITTFMVTGFAEITELAYGEAVQTTSSILKNTKSPQTTLPGKQTTLPGKPVADTQSKPVGLGKASPPPPYTAGVSPTNQADNHRQPVIAKLTSPVRPTPTGTNPVQPAPSVAAKITLTQQEVAPRIKLTVHTTSRLTLDEAIASLTVLDPRIVATELKDGRLLTLTALAQGETVIITDSKTGRRTLVIEVVPQPSKSVAEMSANAARRARASHASGSFSLFYSPSFNQSPDLLRQRFEYTQKLSKGSTLRTSGDWFKFFGAGGANRFSSLATNFGMGRLSFAISKTTSSLDLLDSQLEITPLSLHGYTMRGLHFSSTLAPNVRGLEIFGGLARPSPALFEGSEGYLAGALIPIQSNAAFRLRAGAIAIAPQGNQQLASGGVIWQSDVRFSPNDKTLVEGEVAYSKSELSWRSQISLRRGAFSLLGESLRLDGESPLVSIGAQSGARQANYLSLRWIPGKRFISTVSYNQVTYTPPAFTSRAALNNSSLFIGANFKIFNGSEIGLRFAEQNLEVTTSAVSSVLELKTQTAALTYNARFKKQWSNLLEARLTASQETSIGASVERGLSFREELRHAWARWTATAYANYNFNIPSLTGLVVRNASLLPPLVRQAYEADPVGFLSANRGLLASLLAGIELPETRSFDVGSRVQGIFSRYTLSGDVRYDGGQLLARARRNIFTTLSLNLRLDEANSIQLMAARSLLLSQQGTFLLTAAYTHRFGGGVKGFQFSELLGINEGQLQGRVFSDLNGNGQDEAQEPGIAGIKVQLNDKATAFTDARGRYHFSALETGDYTVAIRLLDLGIRQRASTATEQNFSITGKQHVTVNFGMISSGFISGRVFNDLLLSGGQSTNAAPGVAGVRLNLKPLDNSSNTEVQSRTVDASGLYDFSNLVPGNYLLEIDSSSVPPDFRLPTPQSWTIAVEPVKGHYQDVPLAAQRAISGIVFTDKDGDGIFNPQKDATVANAQVVCGGQAAQTNPNGGYLLRNLPAGKLTILVNLPDKGATGQAVIELGAEPVFLRALHIPLLSQRP